MLFVYVRAFSSLIFCEEPLNGAHESYDVEASSFVEGRLVSVYFSFGLLHFRSSTLVRRILLLVTR